MADAQGPAGNAFGVAVRRKIEAVRAIAQRDPDGGLAGVVERDAARRRVARLVELQASLRRRRVGVRPCLIDPERLSRSQFIGPGLPSLAIQPPRNPTLLIAKMEAYRLHELKTCDLVGCICVSLRVCLTPLFDLVAKLSKRNVPKRTQLKPRRSASGSRNSNSRFGSVLFARAS